MLLYTIYLYNIAGFSLFMLEKIMNALGGIFTTSSKSTNIPVYEKITFSDLIASGELIKKLDSKVSVEIIAKLASLKHYRSTTKPDRVYYRGTISNKDGVLMNIEGQYNIKDELFKNLLNEYLDNQNLIKIQGIYHYSKSVQNKREFIIYIHRVDTLDQTDKLNLVEFL